MTAALQALALTVVAELGDKSQLVCVLLAARYRALPVALGASLAFALLNALAVGVGAGVGAALPARAVALGSAVAFLVFAALALRPDGGEGAPAEVGAGARGALLTAFGAILFAEMGDRTQLAVAALATTRPAAPVWVGATLGLALTSALGAWAGSRLAPRLANLPLRRITAALFVGAALLALLSALR